MKDSFDLCMIILCSSFALFMGACTVYIVSEVVK